MTATAHTQVRLTGLLSTQFVERPEVQELVAAFAEETQPIMWGTGWEVILNRVGLGADYLVNFHSIADGSRWLDFYGHALLVSYHLFGAGAFIDPSLSFGVGAAGRLNMDDAPPTGLDELYLSIFPVVAAGVAVDLGGFVVSSRFSYTPTLSPPPGTDFQNYPLERFQVSVSMGVALGGH
jgi:hypothetical protein